MMPFFRLAVITLAVFAVLIIVGTAAASILFVSGGGTSKPDVVTVKA